MRGMYWKPQGASQVQRALVAALAIVGLIAVERFPSEERQPYYGEKLAAARTAKEALDVIRDTAEAKGIRIRPETDPAASGLIGEVLSPITSGSGSLVSKQTTVNPNFAAVVVEWLKDLGIQSGDLVAVGASGSFPAMNIAVYSALHQLGADPIIITSTAASQYGANVPNFTWLDMEATLRREGVFPYKSVAASRGGVGDEAIGLTKRGRRMLDRAIERNKVPEIREADDSPPPPSPVLPGENGFETTLKDIAAADQDKVLERMRIYRENAGDLPIRAYINVGGGTVSVGTRVGKKKFAAGINRRPPKGFEEMPPSVIGAFLESDVPAIHCTRIIDLAEKYGLEIAPLRTPEVGQGDIFQKRQPNRLLAGAVLLMIVVALFLIARAPWGTRLLRTTVSPQTIAPSQGGLKMAPPPSDLAPKTSSEEPRDETYRRPRV